MNIKGNVIRVILFCGRMNMCKYFHKVVYRKYEVKNTLDGIVCPRCGKEMHHGYIRAGGGLWLVWFPWKKQATNWNMLKFGAPFFKRGSVDDGMSLLPAAMEAYNAPALNCLECKLVLLDYDEEHTFDD